MPENIDAFAAEIKELEAKLEQKKKEMMAAGTEAPEQHVFKQVVREHAGEPAPSAPAFPAAAVQASAAPAPLAPADEQKLDELVSHAFTKGIAAAVSEANKLNIPFLTDMLHDRLADEYYAKLIESRKVNAD